MPEEWHSFYGDWLFKELDKRKESQKLIIIEPPKYGWMNGWRK
jgi:hypothetical protein